MARDFADKFDQVDETKGVYMKPEYLRSWLDRLEVSLNIIRKHAATEEGRLAEASKLEVLLMKVEDSLDKLSRELRPSHYR